MKAINRLGWGVVFGCIVFYLIASGCTWLTFTAEDRLLEKIAIQSSSTIESIYLEFSGPTGKMSSSFGKFQERLKENLTAKGYKIFSSPEGADLVAKFNTQIFMKNCGTQYFFFGLIPTSGLEEAVHKVEGIQVEALYITDKGKWNKTYRAYNRPYDKNNYIKLATAVISDFNQAITKKGQEVQQ